jgi:hypothetical protein
MVTTEKREAIGVAAGREGTMSRRRFLTGAARAAVVAASGSGAMSALSTPARAAKTSPLRSAAGDNRVRELVTSLHRSLDEKQKGLILLPFENRRRRLLGNNWWVVKPTIGEVYSPDQQAMMQEILKRIASEEGYSKFLNVMETDSGGFKNYHAALFGDPEQGKFEWVITGRHITLRADADSVSNAALGGPVLYGHAPLTFVEAADHPKNVFWYQAHRANHVFDMLDGKQRDQALVPKAPVEEAVDLHGPNGPFPGLRVGEMTRDQKAEVEKVLSDLMLPFSQTDADQVRDCLKAGGGADSLRMSFFQEDDLGGDKVWDLWRLEGPSFVWYFRGAPHVHTWVNVARAAPGPLLKADAGNVDANEF